MTIRNWHYLPNAVVKTVCINPFSLLLNYFNRRLQLNWYWSPKSIFTVLYIYRAALNAGRSSYDKAVCLSVRLSVRLSARPVICDKTKETCAHILIPHKRSFILVLWEQDWLVGRPLLPKFWVKLPRWSENDDFQSILSRSASAVTPSKKFNQY